MPVLAASPAGFVTWLMLAAIGAGPLVTGCAHGGGLRKEVIVDFDTFSDPAAATAVRHRCSGLPGVVAEPAGARGGPARFDVRKADDRQLSALFACLGALSHDQALHIRGVRQESSDDLQ